MKKESIIIADDHPLLLKGLSDFLLERGYNVVGSGQNGREAFNLINKLEPEIAILDIQMPFMSGLEIARKCIHNGVNTKIILITFHKEKQLFTEAEELKIYGYILKEFAIEEIENCLNAVLEGKRYFSPKITEMFTYNSPKNEALDSLTPSEKKILKLIALDKTNKEIASVLFISYRTVEKHRSNIITKLDLEHKTNSLLIWAKEHQDKLH
ncbi:MAG: response regulator transcription factor [Flavobacteriaceae bacterium]